MQTQKTETVNRRAKRELENTLKAIKKLETNHCKCKADAEKSIESISKKLKYCTLSDVIYIECTKNKIRGIYKKEQLEEKVTYAVKATATVSLNDKAIAQEIENELKCVIATTDTARAWTAQELYSTYLRQSVIECTWKACKKNNYSYWCNLFKVTS